MIHPGRSGSTVLGSMLRQHPEIRWDKEVFTQLPRNKIPYDPAGNILWRDYISFLINRSRKPTLGIEIKVQQIVQHKVLCEDLETSLSALSEAFDIQLILLTRRNHLERWLSAAVARETSRFQYREGEVAPQIALPLPERVKDSAYGLMALDVNAWLDQVEAIDQALLEAVSTRGGLTLTYEEDILPGPDRAYGKVLDFVGLKALEESKPLYIKGDRRPLSERLSNFTDLESKLRPEHHLRYCQNLA